MEGSIPKPKSAPFSNMGRYKKGGSAGSKGTDYQIGLLVVVLLNAMKKLSMWRLSTENESAGKFDDVVVEWPEGQVLVQAKHKEKAKGITLEDLMSANSKKDEFSVPKYFLSYLKIRGNLSDYHRIIICTNLEVNRDVLLFLDDPVNDPESLLHHEVEDCSYHTFKYTILPVLKENTILYYRQNFLNKGVKESEITDENLQDFLKHLQIYFSYPPQDNMSKVLENLLSSTDCNSKISAVELSSKIKDWFQQKQGEYFSETHAKASFAEIRRDKYFRIMKELNVFFIRKTLSFEGSTRIFKILSQDTFLLQALKTCDTLKDNILKILCFNLGDDLEILKHTVDAFYLPRYTTLLIISPKGVQQSAIMDISDKLKNTLEKYKYKKVILVCEEDNDLFQQLGFSDCCEVIKESVTLEDLSADTQERLLQEKNVVFQGRSIGLKELFAKQMTQDQRKTTNLDILEQLVKGVHIKVGSEVRPLDDDVARYYVERVFERELQGGEEKWTDSKRKQSFSENKIYDVSEKVVLIQDIAGAGKSTVLAHLAFTIKETNPHLWVIFIKLNECTEILNKSKLSNKKSITVPELLSSRNVTKLTNKLEELVFMELQKVVLLVDGVDEISPDYTSLVLDLLVECQNEPNFAKVVVTTRPHMAKELEDTLNIKSFKLQPFTDQSQKSFLAGYWSHHLKVEAASRHKCERYAEELLRKTTSWTYVYNKQHFAAIPLQVSMMAEIFQESSRLKGLTDWEGCKEFVSGNNDSPKLPERINIPEIYEMFIEMKRNVFTIKANPCGNTSANLALSSQFDECLFFHRKLALEEVLQESERNLFLEYQQNVENNDRVTTAVLRVGIVQKSENYFYFCHRTFAEYFVAESILKELQLQVPQNPEQGFYGFFDKMRQILKLHTQHREKAFQKFFFDRVLLRPEFEIVRSFFNSFLQNVVDSLPSNTFQCYESLSYEISLWNNYNLIHQLVVEGCIAILQLLFKCIDFQIVKDREVEINDVFDNYSKYNNTLTFLRFLVQQGGVNIKAGRTPLFYASESGNLEMVKFLIDHGANISSTMLHEGICQKHVDVVIYLLERTVEQDIAQNLIVPYTFAFLGQGDQLRKLVDNGLDVNSRTENGEPLLFGAAHGGQLDIIRFLVHQGANVNSRDENGNTALHVIARKPSCIAAAGLLIDLGINVNAKNQGGNTALHYSIKNIEMVKLLVKSGLNVNCRDDSGKTALWEAIWWRQLDTIKFLIAHGCDVNIANNGGRKSIHLAAEWGELDFVRFLLGSCADVSISYRDVNTTDDYGNTPLHSAASRGEKDTAEYLLQAGADANKINGVGYTALHAAAFWGRLGTVRLLVKHTDLNIRDKKGRTPLLLSVWENRLDIVQCLVENSADVNVKDDEGHTALHLAASKGQLVMVRYLVDHSADVNARFIDGQTALHLAVSNNHLDVVIYLVEHSADINTGDNEGRTALHLSASKDELDVTKCLVEHFADVNIRNKQGNTALHLAASEGLYQTVKYLLKNSADVNCRNNHGYTALHSAVLKGHRQTVKCILEYSADVNALDDQGRTALHLLVAESKCVAYANCRGIVKALVNRGANLKIKDSSEHTAYTLAKMKNNVYLLRYLKPKPTRRKVQLHSGANTI